MRLKLEEESNDKGCGKSGRALNNSRNCHTHGKLLPHLDGKSNPGLVLQTHRRERPL